MFRRIEDFQRAWAQESEATLTMLRALTEPSLSQAVAPGGRTLGRLAWHLVLTLGEMMGQAGLGVPGPTEGDPQPPLREMIRQYESAARAVGEAVAENWTEAMLTENIPMYGEQWPRGNMLWALMAHQAHHRGQMTVLMRQAGLKVPGIYGPAREEWAALNMPAPE
jgi:uncharacterized damage-inducible protein DinB